jgi:hypothetical protein
LVICDDLPYNGFTPFVHDAWHHYKDRKWDFLPAVASVSISRKAGFHVRNCGFLFTGTAVSNRPDWRCKSDRIIQQVSSFSQTPFKWAVANSIISGKKISGTSYLSPKGKATRAECAAIIMRFINKFGQ